MFGPMHQSWFAVVQTGAWTIGAFVTLIPDEAGRKIDAPQRILVPRLAHHFQDQAFGIREEKQITRRRYLLEQAPHLRSRDFRKRPKLCSPLTEDTSADVLA